MISTKSPCMNMLDEVFKSSLFVENETCYLKYSLSSSFIPQLREIIGYKFEIRYFHPNIKCPKCNVEFNRNGSNQISINNLFSVRKQKYICPICKGTYYIKISNMAFCPI
ncbi:MAG: hypothetical protein LBB45_01075 [Methanobrevibacter sp.]|nr:hypothetical protein [Candidatus Methanovirga basalitermitum]